MAALEPAVDTVKGDMAQTEVSKPVGRHYQWRTANDAF